MRGKFLGQNHLRRDLWGMASSCPWHMAGGIGVRIASRMMQEAKKPSVFIAVVGSDGKKGKCYQLMV